MKTFKNLLKIIELVYAKHLNMGPGTYYKIFLISSGSITHMKWFLKNLNRSLSPLKEYKIYSGSFCTRLPVTAIESNQIILDKHFYRINKINKLYWHYRH